MLPGLLVSLVCLVILFLLVDLNELIRALKLANYWLILAGWGITVLWLLIRTLVWRTLLKSSASYGDYFFTINQGYLINNFLPLRMGELGRAFLLSQKARVDFFQVLSSILIERALDILIAVSIFVTTIPIVVDTGRVKETAILTGIVVLLGMAGLYMMAHFRDRIALFLERTSQHWTLLARLGLPRIKFFLEGLSILTHGWRFLVAFLFLSVNWVVAVLQFYVVLIAFFPRGSLLWATFGLSATALGIAAPSSPGALGVFEAVVLWAFSFFTKNQSRALAFAFIFHLSNYLITGILGSFAFFRQGQNFLQTYYRIRNLR